MKNIIYSKYSNERADQFKIRTDIVEDLEGKKYVHKIPLTKEARIHLENIYKNFKLLSEVYTGSKMRINNCCKIDNGLEFEYITGITLEEELDTLLLNKDYVQIIEKITEYVSLLQKSMDDKEFKLTEDFTKIFGNVKFKMPLKAGKVNDIDLNFNNIILGEYWNVIDYEWTFNFPIPLNYIIYRAIFWYITNSEKRTELKELGLYKLVGITDEEIVQYGIMETNFQNYVVQGVVQLNNLYGYTTKKNLNIQEIIEKESRESFKNEVQIFCNYGNGFNEEQSYKLNPLEDVCGKISFEIPITSGIKQIRIDPCNSNSIVVIDKIIGYSNQYYTIDYYTNGIDLKSNTILFATNDPQIILTDISSDTINIEVQMYVQLLFKDITIELCNYLQENKKNMDNEMKKINGKINTMVKENERITKENETIIRENENAMKENEKNVKDLTDDYNKAILEKEKLELRVNDIESAYNVIMKSASWRITKPVRITLDLLKKVLKKVKNKILSRERAVELKDGTSIKYNIDGCIYENNILSVQGWIFNFDRKIEGLSLIFDDGKQQYKMKTLKSIERQDVYSVYGNENSLYSGFSLKARIKNIDRLLVYLEIDGEEKILIDEIKGFESEGEIVIEPIDDSLEINNIMEFKKENVISSINYPEEVFKFTIDIIIPVYNGYEYLEKLFSSIVKTRMKYRLIIINDKSPDKRVSEFLNDYASTNEVILIENSNNLGFVKSVNKGFEVSTNHVALLNTDIELPSMWLERLMVPILLNLDVASSTPFTNCGTICSFPNFCEDNAIFEGMNVDHIDLAFQEIKPNYTSLPTGVGFCMGINKNALEKVGYFDDNTFAKGYGEENDWCQRAIKNGYRNVQVENLYVYHKHGGSFLSEEKKKLLERNGTLLSKKHPNYNSDVAYFCQVDPVKDIRNYILFKILSSKNNGCSVYFDHNLGGGATSYLNRDVAKKISNGEDIIIIRYDVSSRVYTINYRYKEYNISYYCVKFDDILDVLMDLKISKICINELVTYPNLYSILEKLIEFKNVKNIEIIMLLHDLFCICPTINLLNDKGCYCNIPRIEECKECLMNNKLIHYGEYDSMERWRECWKDFLSQCNKIIVFSENSRDLMEKSYGLINNVDVIPHSVDYMIPLIKKYKTTKTLNIGLLGVLGFHKGIHIIRQMLELIKNENLDIKIILIGSTTEELNHKDFRQIGEYTTDSIPKLVLENDIDLFFISSIWPETFSYTTQEVISMGLPIVSFDIGAPAERIKKYKNGLVLDSFNVKKSLNDIIDFSRKFNYKTEDDTKVLFIGEYLSFSSRYRVEHFREQLLINGIKSDFSLVEDLAKYNIEEYETIVIYRCRYNDSINNFIEECHKKGKKVFYDIDDYIFDYNKIKHLGFLNGEDYVDFDKYSSDIYKCMSLSDGFITSTENMKKSIESSFVNKPVCVNRNVASMEMFIISLKAKSEIIKNKEKVVIGYFSGSKTHDKDFEIISNVLLDILKNNENVYLKIGGCLNLPKEFEVVKQRIEFVGFVDWKRLPYLIASVDINLLPVEDTFFHSCKSENKWTEAALVGVPTVASCNSELENVIRNNENGLLCKAKEEWADNLNKLIQDLKFRTEISQNAYNTVLKKYITTNSGIEAINFILNKDV
ncbi:MAG: glycosyltransferase [Clostridium beijerinckii]|nr:glycosyltransferase [Clostridium beijerinckii]